MGSIPVGIQLYTVRQQLGEDFDGVVRALARMGYQGVEFAGKYGERSPAELKAFLDDLGLRVCGMHCPLDALLDAGSDAYKTAATLGSPYVTTSCAPQVAKDWAGTMDKIVRAGAVAASRGLTFTYHNHAQEFAPIEGKYALDALYERAPAATVQAELDTYWIQKGGVEPLAYLKKYAGRVPQVHLKDMAADDGSFAEVGEGILNMAGICAEAPALGARWLIVEQDVCRRPPLESAKISIENLKKLGAV